MSVITATQKQQSIALPPPQTEHAMTLMQALKHRRSAREFAPKPLPRETLSTLLWAAFGINRPADAGRTAPSAHNWQEIGVYAALADGIYRYDAAGHALQLAASGDLRSLTGVQDFVGQAPLDLVYVADFSRMSDAGAEERTFFCGRRRRLHRAERVSVLCRRGARHGRARSRGPQEAGCRHGPRHARAHHAGTDGGLPRAMTLCVHRHRPVVRIPWRT